MFIHIYYQKRVRILRFEYRKTTIIANMLSYATQKSLGIMPALCRIIQLDTEPALCSKLLDPFFVRNLVSGKFWNPESWALKSRIQVPLTKNPKPVPGFRNLRRGIQNLRLSWIPLNGVNYAHIIRLILLRKYTCHLKKTDVFGSFLALSRPTKDVPATRLYTWGSLLLTTRWAALMSHLGLIREAPQECPFVTFIDSCQGHEWGAAVEPPIILTRLRTMSATISTTFFTINRSTIERFHMTSRRPFWCSKQWNVGHVDVPN